MDQVLDADFGDDSLWFENAGDSLDLFCSNDDFADIRFQDSEVMPNFASLEDDTTTIVSSAPLSFESQETPKSHAQEPTMTLFPTDHVEQAPEKNTNDVQQLRRMSLPSRGKPQSKRAKLISVGNEVHEMFKPWLSFLTQCTPLKNINALFDDLQYFIDDCLVHFVTKFDYVVSCATLMTWLQMLAVCPLQKPCVWTRITLSLSEAPKLCTYDLFLNRLTRSITLVEFKSINSQFDSATNGEVVDVFRKHFEVPCDVAVTVLSLPLISSDVDSNSRATKKHKSTSTFLGKRSRGSNKKNSKKSRAVSSSCAARIWSLIFVCLVNGMRSSPDVCYLQTLAHSEENSNTLFHATIQSLLYFCAEHDELLSIWLNDNHIVQSQRRNEQTDKRLRGAATMRISCAVFDWPNVATASDRKQFVSKLFTQTNQKSLIAVRKQSGNRVGKFKGRQHDKLLCITINGTIGFQLTFDSLFRSSIFTQLMDAQKVPRQSEICYSDLVAHLPFIFPPNWDCNFGANFMIRTPYMETADPERMFGPISSMLWPDVRDVDTLFSKYLKTYKLEFEIIETQDPQQRSLSACFIRDLDLSPNKPWQDFRRWVSVVGVDNDPLSIYVEMPQQDLSSVSREIAQRLGLQMSPNAMLDLAIVQSPTSMVHVQWKQPVESMVSSHDKNAKKSQPVVSWKGSREHGFAVRRFFKTGKVMIHVFASMRDFIQREQRHETPKIRLSDHMFAVLDVASVLRNPSQVDDTTPLLSYEQLQSQMRKVNFEKNLIVVDDIGIARYYLLGNSCRKVASGQPQYKCCKNCKFDIILPLTHENSNENDTETQNRQWFGKLKEMTKPSRELHANDVMNYPFVMAHDSKPMVLCNDIMHTKTLRQQSNAMSNCSNATFRCAFVGAVYNPDIEYVNTYKEVTDRLMRHALSMTVSQGCMLQPLKQGSTASFRVQMQGHCKCCDSHVRHCPARIASALLIMDLFESVSSISTSIVALQGQTVQSVPFQVPCGLRCSHDWTNGSGDVFFRGTFADPAFGESIVNLEHDTVHVVDEQELMEDIYAHSTRMLVLSCVV